MPKASGHSRAAAKARVRSVPESSRIEKKLPLAKCRALLGLGPTLSDAELERLRDDLRLAATVIVDGFLRSRNSVPAAAISGNGALHSDADTEERAAIMEYEGKMSRRAAERASGLLAAAPKRASSRIH